MINGVSDSWKFILSVICLLRERTDLCGQVENAKPFVLSLLKGNSMACNCDDVDKGFSEPKKDISKSKVRQAFSLLNVVMSSMSLILNATRTCRIQSDCRLSQL